MYDGECKEGEPLDLMLFPDDIIDFYNEKSTDDQWGEAESMLYYFDEEMFDVPTMGEIQSEGDSEQFSKNSSTTVKEDLHLIDIESLFDNEPESNKSNKIVLTREEAEELFA